MTFHSKTGNFTKRFKRKYLLKWKFWEAPQNGGDHRFLNNQKPLIKRYAFILLSIFFLYVLRISFKTFFCRDLTPLLFLLLADSLVSFILYWFIFLIVVVFILFSVFLMFIYFILIYFMWMRLFICFALSAYLFLLSNDFIFHLVFWSILYVLKLFVSYLSEMVPDLDKKFWRILSNHSVLSNH